MRDGKKTLLFVMDLDCIDRSEFMRLGEILDGSGFESIAMFVASAEKPVDLYDLDSLTPAEKETLREIVKKHTGETF